MLVQVEKCAGCSAGADRRRCWLQCWCKLKNVLVAKPMQIGEADSCSASACWRRCCLQCGCRLKKVVVQIEKGIGAS